MSRTGYNKGALCLFTLGLCCVTSASEVGLLRCWIHVSFRMQIGELEDSNEYNGRIGKVDM